jgi:hypothetical protein
MMGHDEETTMNVSEHRMEQMLDEIESKKGPARSRRNVRDRLPPLGFDAALRVAATMSDDFATDEPSIVAPRRTPAAFPTVTTKVKRFGRVCKFVIPGGTGDLDTVFSRSSIRRLDEIEIGEECFSGRPDAVEDAIIALLDGGRRRPPSRMFATMSVGPDEHVAGAIGRVRVAKPRRRGRWLEGKVRKGAVPRM